MRTSDEIAHEGRIVSVGSQSTTVEIISESACSSCHAKSLCSISESKAKTIEVPTTSLDWEVGQSVDVILKKTMGYKAVWVAYVIPLIIMVAVLLICTTSGTSELVAGLCSIAAIALYYLGIWLFADKLKKEYSFYIRKK